MSNIKGQNPDSNKVLAIKYYKENNVTQKEVSKIFNITRQTFIQWKKQYDNGNISRKKRYAMSYKIKKKHVKHARKLLKKNNELSIKILWSKLKTKYSDFDVSQGHLAKVIRDINITRKRTTRRHFPDKRYGKSIDLNKELKNFYKVTDQYPLDTIISIDETSVYAQIPSNYSRCDLSKRCVLKTKNNKVFTKYTLVCAMTSKGIGFELYEKGGMNAERMIEFINKYIKNKFKNALVIMDNGGSHKNKLIGETIKKTENNLLYSEILVFIKKIIRSIPKKTYLNYMKYAYETKTPKQYVEKKSSRRKKLKKYKS
jgi:transposase